MRTVDAAPSWSEAYELHADRLTKLAVLLVGAADANDLVADGVHRAIASPGWKRVEHHGAYLARTLINLAEDRRRSTERRGRRELRAVRLHDRRSVAEPDIERGLVVRAALDALSANQLAVVYLHYWEDLALDQVAVELGLGVGTIRTHLDRAKKRLRGSLHELNGEHS